MTDAAWWRAWATPSGVVAVVDGDAASVRALDERPVTVVSLPN
ncbi:hypothetical protein [Agromyces albus]|nr:hypothetical protein [Agromyces albus]